MLVATNAGSRGISLSKKTAKATKLKNNDEVKHQKRIGNEKGARQRGKDLRPAQDLG